MATEFKPSVLVSDVFGSAGDVTAVHRDGTTFLRKRVSAGGGRELSDAQEEHLEVHRRALAAWRELPQAVQEEWNKYALGAEPHRPPFDHSSWISGQNLFVSAYHGFHTLGRERVPKPRRFDGFPPFAVKKVEAVVVETSLVLRLWLAGLEHVKDPSRYWVYGYFRLTVPGRGEGTNIPKRTVLASGSCEAMPVEVVLDDYLGVWGLDLEAYQVHSSLVLLDAKTGFRSQRQKMSGVVQLKKKEDCND